MASPGFHASFSSYASPVSYRYPESSWLPDERVINYCRERAREPFEPVYADADATYIRQVEVDVQDLGPMASRPGHPDDAVPVSSLAPVRIDSIFIGSCTNGRLSDLREAASILHGRKVHPGVVLKIVPTTDRIWRQALAEGIWQTLKDAGALVGNAGCGGCAAGQIGQNGPGEITVSTGNRNFPGKQGQGQVYLASPRTAAASAVAGVLVSAEQLLSGQIPARPAWQPVPSAPRANGSTPEAPTTLRGRAWVVDVDSIDTDMIYHNRHLAETDPARMGQYAFGNLPGWQSFPDDVRPGDIVVTGANFGCGSSRQQAVTCFRSLGVACLVARSFGAIYERNAINEAMPILVCDWKPGEIQDGDLLELDLTAGIIRNTSRELAIRAQPFSKVQLDIYRRGGLLKG